MHGMPELDGDSFEQETICEELPGHSYLSEDIGCRGNDMAVKRRAVPPAQSGRTDQPDLIRLESDGFASRHNDLIILVVRKDGSNDRCMCRRPPRSSCPRCSNCNITRPFTDSHLLSNHQQCLPSDIGTAAAPLSARPPSSVPGARKPNDARPQRVHRSCVAFVAFHQQELTSYARVHPSLAASAQPTHPDAVAACGAHMHCGPFTVRSRRSDGNERFNDVQVGSGLKARGQVGLGRARARKYPEPDPIGGSGRLGSGSGPSPGL
ncbi:hypothetical protein B0H10DRAFT_2229927 [Mycena sp. CBHHK59/15]|nr:hypothetical protein B0H10DRAFT_2229927 [Mycena sp. CBHHK59/15]